jgi:regulator of sirC expression with transglutaminase-like and TPR domain
VSRAFKRGLLAGSGLSVRIDYNRAVRAPFHADHDDDLSVEREAFNVDDDDFDLLRAATLLPRVEAREPDTERVLADVEAMVDGVRARAGDDPSWPEPLVALTTELFEARGLRGDHEDYDDPRNSFLDDVLERRRGLPISLSLLAAEVGQRAGIHTYGISFPGHFLVGVQNDATDAVAELIVLDAFEGGRVLTAADLERLLGRALGRPDPVKLTPLHLSPATPGGILWRMLANLRGSYARRRDLVPLCRVLNRMLLLHRRDAELLAQRAAVRRNLLDSDGARQDALDALDLCEAEEPAGLRARRVLELLDADRRWVH